MTGAEKLRQEGHERGLRVLVVRLLGVKFGPLPTSAVMRIDAATVAELEQFCERALTATSLDEVLTER